MTQPEWSNWMCPKCGTSDLWFSTRTDCCGARTVAAYSDLRCAFCAPDRSHPSGWRTYTDGVTRPCPCSAFSIDPPWPVPNPSQRDGLSATVLVIVINGFAPGAFVVPVSLPSSEEKSR